MPLPTRTLDTIQRRIMAAFRTSFGAAYPLGTKKFLGRLARAVSLNVWGFQKVVEDLDLDIVPSPQSSTDALSDWAALLGLPDGAGGYGRLKPTLASGGVATLTGVLGTIFPTATPADGHGVAVAEDGETLIGHSGIQTIPGAGSGFGSVVGNFVAVTVGTAGNLPTGTVCTWLSPPSGADTSFTLTSPPGSAIDAETNAQVYARIVARLQTPPRGGTSEDYLLWCEEVAGIIGVCVYPRRSGTGSVDMVIIAGGSGQGRVPSAAQKADAEAVVLAKRPVAVEGTNVLLPLMPDANGHIVRVRVEPSKTKYDFDWDDTGGTYSVDSYSSGPPAWIRLNVVAPASLKVAVDAYLAGTADKPRLQVLSTNGPAVNAPIGVIAYDADLTKTTLTLESLPVDWALPGTFDKIYAYGPCVPTIAAGVLALCDSLGSSRSSGFGDPLSPWLYKLTISGIIRVAEDAIDTDGSKLIEEVLVGNATIDGSAADVIPSDLITTNPEILFLKHVAVTA